MTLHSLTGDARPSSPALSPDLLAVIVTCVAFLVSGLFLLTLVPDRSRRAPPAPIPAAANTSSSPPLPRAPPECEGQPEARARASPKGLPVERDGIRETLPPAEVFAVHANAHYTYVYNGRETLFCSLSIGEAEASLASERFLRVHRSHIVNLDHVANVRKAGDNGVAELAGPGRVQVPVSRARLPELRSRLASLRREAAE